MNHPTRPDYLELEQILGQAEATAGAAEVHGLLCGLLCAAGRIERRQWDAQIFADAAASAAAVERGREAVQSLADWTTQALNDPVLGMDLLLPAEGQGLFERTAALGEWCQGYLLGLAAGGIAEGTPLPDDVAELIRDFTEISRVGFEVDDEDDSDEVAFSDVVEYVRVGVLLINDELQPLKPASRLQ